FRVSNRESWLLKMSLVYGLAVTNNWAMVGFFPFFLVALIWIKERSFFNYRFILKMIAFGAIGLSFYLLLPIVVGAVGNSEHTFMDVFRENRHFQKMYLFDIPFKQYPVLRSHLFVMALTSILPLLLIGIRWPSFRGDISPSGTTVATFLFRLMHLVLLGLCLWVFFDPLFSPRSLGYDLTPFLTFYYLTALSVGYFVGFVLLVFGRPPVQAWSRAVGISKMVDPIVLGIVGVAIVAVPIGLFRKNFPIIRANNSDALRQYAQRTADGLPEKGAVVLSDDPLRLYLVQAAAPSSKATAKNIFVETGALPQASYQNFLRRRYAESWPALGTNALNEPELIQRLDTLSKSHAIFYLHPSFGYYFEKFYAIPHKLVYELQTYTGTNLPAPPLSPTVIAENQTFWNSQDNELFTLARTANQSPEIKTLNVFYSRALNNWGVELQKAKLLKEAGAAFAQAYLLNSENAVAQINQQFNAGLQKGEIRPIEANEELEKKLGQYRVLQGALNWNGPFDEPAFCVQLGEEFGRGGNLRQSAQFFLRALEISPQNFGARLGLSKSYIELKRPDDAMKLISELRNDPKISLLNTNIDLELLRLEALSFLAKNDFPTAEKTLVTASQQKPKDEGRLAVLAQFYLDVRRPTNAIETVQRQLQLSPENPNALFMYAVLNMQTGNFPAAIETLNHLLKLQPDNQNALLNRAISNLQSGKLDDAKRDYESLLEVVPPSAYQIYYGLAKVAEKQKNGPNEIKNYKLYLKHAPPGTREFSEVQARLKTLEHSKN
ncbi:MAG: tetratricopeptide repeat protein, partial [Verrucomicrobiota bacterium]